MTSVRIDTLSLLGLVPRARPLYRQAFDTVGVLRDFGILDNRLRAEHFLAQLLHESSAMRFLVEDLNYSAKRLTEVWPSRFPSLASAIPFAHDPRALAAQVYDGRLGNLEPGDGLRFLGRGLLQLTGRRNYTRVGDRLEVDLVANPDLVLLPEYALRVAGAVWEFSACNVPADRDDLAAVTGAINGGLTGLADRGAWLQAVRDGRVVRA